MIHADKQDTDALCAELGLDESSSKEFQQTVSKCLIKYSEWSFLRETMSEEKQSSEIIQKLNNIETSLAMITDKDLRIICNECNVNADEVRDIIGWYKVFQPMPEQTKGKFARRMISDLIKKVYKSFDLPFTALQDADIEDIDQLCSDIGLGNDQIDYFKQNAASQFKIDMLLARQ